MAVQWGKVALLTRQRPVPKGKGSHSGARLNTEGYEVKPSSLMNGVKMKRGLDKLPKYATMMVWKR